MIGLSIMTTFSLTFTIPAAGSVVGPLPFILTGGASYTVAWGDGTTDTDVLNTHTYGSAGVKLVILTVSSGSITAFGGVSNAVWGQKYLTDVNATLPSTITDLSNTFNGATQFNSASVSNWDTSNVLGMFGTFAGASAFNQPLNWNTSNVTDMTAMFIDAVKFNQPLNWDTSKVTGIRDMFNGASAFNQDISNWNTSAVSDVLGSMGGMFNGASAFNQDIGKWNISSIGDMSVMLNNSGINAWNYDHILEGWASQAVAKRPSWSRRPILYDIWRAFTHKAY